MKKSYACKASRYLFPTMEDIKDEVKRYIEQEMTYEGEVAGNIKSAMLARLESLCCGSKGFMFNTRESLNMAELMKQKAVFEMEGLADDADKAFCVGLLVVFINEYRQTSAPNKKLDHLLVIEEAHRLLKNVETERTSENMGNPKGKAVEHFTNMIAEMRSFGQGVIIAEQIPSKLAPDVIKNTSNKIVQRVVSADDQSLIANTIGMKAEDAIHLGALKSGFALCHKEGMSLPVLVKVQKTEDKEFIPPNITESFDAIDYQIVRDALHGKQNEYAVKLLNAIMSQDASAFEKTLGLAEEYASWDMKLEDVRLLDSSKAKKRYDEAICDAAFALLSHGMYSAQMMVPDKVVSAVESLFIESDEENVKNAQRCLREDFYKKELYTQCERILKALVLRDYEDKVDIEKSLNQYFFFPQKEFVQTLADSIKEEARKYAD